MFAANVSVAARMKYDSGVAGRQILKDHIRTSKDRTERNLIRPDCFTASGRINQINFAVRYLAATTPAQPDYF